LSLGVNDFLLFFVLFGSGLFFQHDLISQLNFMEDFILIRKEVIVIIRLLSKRSRGRSCQGRVNLGILVFVLIFL